VSKRIRPARSAPRSLAYVAVRLLQVGPKMVLTYQPAFTFYLQIATLLESRRADSNRLPLLQLRVIIHALQGFAHSCNSRISKGFSFLWLALCCTVLRSLWYQGGIKGLPRMHRDCCSTSDLSMFSLFPECAGTPHPWIATLIG
jgi:hypothetical protein